MRVFALLLLVAACGDKKAPTAPPGEPEGPVAPADAQAAVGDAPGVVENLGVIDAPVSVRSSSELKARVTITNPGPADIHIPRGNVDHAMLALEVRQGGQRVNPVPPPVPRTEDAEMIVVAAGATLVRDYLMNVYSPELPPGEYTLHCRMISCAPVTFTVAP